MKFFRQKSSQPKRLSVYSYKDNSGSIDEIVKKLRIALHKNIDESEDNLNAETTKNNIKLYLEILRYNISDRIEVNNDQNGNNNDMISFTDELFSSDILLEIVQKMPEVGFESKKIISAIIGNALLLQIGDRSVTVEYMAKEANILLALIESYKYGRSDITLNCGKLIRDCIQYECLARKIFYSNIFNQFFTYVKQTTFDVAMDAFLTFRLLLTTHKSLTIEYLVENYKTFFDNYNQLIKCDNYVTKRQSLEILALILSEKQNIKVRQLFIMDTVNLRVIMNLFWHKYKHIRFGALNIFNVIINSQEKPIAVMDFLMTNKDKLVQVLNEFLNECNGSKVFTDQKPFVTQIILELNTQKS